MGSGAEPAIDITARFGEEPDVAEVDFYVRTVMQKALDKLAGQGLPGARLAVNRSPRPAAGCPPRASDPLKGLPPCEFR
jgi:hypothetical protein